MRRCLPFLLFLFTACGPQLPESAEQGNQDRGEQSYLAATGTPDDALRVTASREQPPASLDSIEYAPPATLYPAAADLLRLHLYTHDARERGTGLTAVLPALNALYAQAGIQFQFSPATDLEYVAATPVGPGEPASKACESSSVRAQTLRGALALVLCPEQGGGYSGASLDFALIGTLNAGHISHEIGHYFGLAHIFREYDRPFDRDLAAPPGADCGADETDASGHTSRWFSTECRVRLDVTNRWSAERRDRCCIENTHGALICNSTCMNTIPPDILDWGRSRLLYWTDGDGIADTAPAWHEDGSLPTPCKGSVSLTFSFGRQTRTYSVTPGWNNPESYYGCSEPLAFSGEQASRIRRSLFTQANRTHLLKRALSLRETRMSDGEGFTVASAFETLQLADVNGDGKADLCARTSSGIVCELSDGTAFRTVLTQPAFSDANGWGKPEYYRTIAFPDLNRDGKADVCGRGGPGVWCALSDGARFGTATLWASEFSDANGWNGVSYYTTLQYADVDGDGRADLCGRGSSGIYCALSDGSRFGSPTLWSTNYSDANGWSAGPQYYKTIRFPDVNGDGRADLCGRGSAGVACETSTGRGFAGLSLWQANHSDANGWNRGPQYYETLRYADVDGDSRLDLCARGAAGILCGLSTGTSFRSPTLWTSRFGDADGGDQAQYYATLSFPDVDRDGRADFCGRGAAGLVCFSSNGLSFELPRLFTDSLSNADGWSPAQYSSTIRFADIDGDGDLEACGRGAAGVYCSE